MYGISLFQINFLWQFDISIYCVLITLSLPSLSVRPLPDQSLFQIHNPPPWKLDTDFHGGETKFTFLPVVNKYSSFLRLHAHHEANRPAGPDYLAPLPSELTYCVLSSRGSLK